MDCCLCCWGINVFPQRTCMYHSEHVCTILFPSLPHTHTHTRMCVIIVLEEKSACCGTNNHFGEKGSTLFSCTKSLILIGITTYVPLKILRLYLLVCCSGSLEAKVGIIMDHMSYMTYAVCPLPSLVICREASLKRAPTDHQRRWNTDQLWKKSWEY